MKRTFPALNNTWRKSTYSGAEGNACVEAADFTTLVGVRDSKDTDLTPLTFAPSSWSAFVTGLRTDGFEARS
ncbi:DUF397 domain-containing protein [Streptomyces sp. NPDC059783]|uniref:DUF397 domain-containing protein n=1 Tax=Streptomyces sp. NPDC059783 TaxID=3346944 RepID=UPI003652878F